MHRFAYGLVIAAALCGCQRGGRPAERNDAQSVRRVIDSLNARLEGWYAAGQIDSVASVFAEDAWQMPPNNPPLVGRDSIRAFWAIATTWGQWSFDLETEEVMVAESLAVERGRYTLAFQAGAAAPMPSVQDRGNYVVLWRLEGDGRWRIKWDAPVSVLPAAGGSQAGAARPSPRPRAP